MVNDQDLCGRTVEDSNPASALRKSPGQQPELTQMLGRNRPFRTFQYVTSHQATTSLVTTSPPSPGDGMSPAPGHGIGPGSWFEVKAPRFQPPITHVLDGQASRDRTRSITRGRLELLIRSQMRRHEPA